MQSKVSQMDETHKLNYEKPVKVWTSLWFDRNTYSVVSLWNNYSLVFFCLFLDSKISIKKERGIDTLQNSLWEYVLASKASTSILISCLATWSGGWHPIGWNIQMELLDTEFCNSQSHGWCHGRRSAHQPQLSIWPKPEACQSWTAHSFLIF